MLILKFLVLVFKTLFLFLSLFFRYFLVATVKSFYFFLFSPLAVFFLFKSFFIFSLFLIRSLLGWVILWLSNFYSYVKLVHVREPLQQLFHHLQVYSFFKEKVFRRYYFYRRSYRLSNRSLKALVKAILTVELNALLIKRLVQPLRSLWPKLLKNGLTTYTTAYKNSNVEKLFP